MLTLTRIPAASTASQLLCHSPSYLLPLFTFTPTPALAFLTMFRSPIKFYIYSYIIAPKKEEKPEKIIIPAYLWFCDSSYLTTPPYALKKPPFYAFFSYNHHPWTTDYFTFLSLTPPL